MRSRNLIRTLAAALAVVGCAAPLCAADAPTASDVGLAGIDMRPAPLRLVAAETRYWSRLGNLIGSGDLRRLRQVESRFELLSAFNSDDPLLDPFYDHSRSTVRDSYLKLYKEVLRREYVDDFVEENLRQHFSSEVVTPGSSWGLRLSPRLAVGRHGYVGATLDAPHVPIKGLQNFSFLVQRGIQDNETDLALRYQSGTKYWQIERVTGDPATGSRIAGSLVLRF